MSSTYSSPRSTRAIEQRIYSLSIHGDSTETINTTALPKPPRPLNPAVPRIRILLAPYMSPYVVPLHKVRTWESLHRTLHSLFGPDVFNGSELRITDYKGNTILPAIWRDLLEPNITIIVDTCAYIPESSPIIFEGRRAYPPTKGYGQQRERGRRTHSKGGCRRQQHKNMEQYTGQYETYAESHEGSYGDLDSATATILAERESEDSSYENANIISPLGHVGQAALTAPLGSLKSRPMQAWEGWATSVPTDLSASGVKRNTSVSMFAGKRQRRECENSATVAEVHISTQEKKKKKKTRPTVTTVESEPIGFVSAEKETGYTNTITTNTTTTNNVTGTAATPPCPTPPLGRHESISRQKKKSKPRKSWMRIARVILLAFSGGQQKSHSGADGAGPDPNAPDPAPKRARTVAARKPEQMATPNLPKHTSLGPDTTLSPKTSLSRRRGVPTLPPVQSGRMTFDFPFADPKEVRRSRSLNSLLEACNPSQAVHTTTTTQVSSLGRRPSKLGSITRSESHKERNLLRKASAAAATNASQLRKESTISPPIPRRPVQELGTTAQFKTPHLDRAAIQEIASEHENSREHSQLDGSTLGGSYSSRSRGGSDASTVTPIAEESSVHSSSSPTPKHNRSNSTPEKKPLPKLPYKFSAFPPRSPPRSPVAILRLDGKTIPPRLPAADRRPTGTKKIDFGQKKGGGVVEGIKRIRV